MDTFLTILLWGGALFLLMRFGCGRHLQRKAGETPPVAGRGEPRIAATSGDLRWLPPEEEVDPVCGRRVRTADAKTSVRNGWVYYFCSSACRETFETAAMPAAAPAREDPQPARARTEGSHV